MPDWNNLSSEQDLIKLDKESMSSPCLIYKHSTSCSISAFAKMRIQAAWKFSPEEVKPYHLDLLRYRSVSNFVADHYDVGHESPQILLIIKGVCVFHASHLDIRVSTIRKIIEQSLPEQA